ncbi:MAG: CDP-archaeol synthase [Gammaproteobacteria bacterium]|nr:CDP-archaeol synthase [Gammaproteobacteria bacterium]
MLELKILLLLIIANGAPIIARNLLGRHLDLPVDMGAHYSDKRPLFGPSKTIRGVLAALIVTPICSSILGVDWFIGLMIAMYAMLGDLISSFIKRRKGIESSGMAFGIDQIPEALLPLLAIRSLAGLSWFDVVTLVLVFVALELILSRILFNLNIRNRPY